MERLYEEEEEDFTALLCEERRYHNNPSMCDWFLHENFGKQQFVTGLSWYTYRQLISAVAKVNLRNRERTVSRQRKRDG